LNKEKKKKKRGRVNEEEYRIKTGPKTRPHATDTSHFYVNVDELDPGVAMLDCNSEFVLLPDDQPTHTKM